MNLFVISQQSDAFKKIHTSISLSTIRKLWNIWTELQNDVSQSGNETVYLIVRQKKMCICICMKQTIK